MSSSFMTPQQVSQFVQNFIILYHQFSYRSRGLFRQEMVAPPQNIYYLQDLVDQFISVLPFGGIPSAFVQVPMNQRSNPDLFLNSSNSEFVGNLDLPSLGLELTNKTTSMNSIAALLQISASALGIQMSPSFQQESEHALLLLLQRFPWKAPSSYLIPGTNPAIYHSGPSIAPSPMDGQVLFPLMCVNSSNVPR